MDHKHPVTDRLHIFDDMCGEQNDLVLRHLRENVAEFDALLGIQTDSRLVQYDQLRIAEECLRDPDALALAAGESADTRLSQRCHVCAFQHFCDRFGVPYIFERRHVVQKLPDCQLIVQSEVLRQIAKL